MIMPSTCVGFAVTPSIRGTAVAVDVGVDDPDRQALGGHRRGQVRRDRRLADAALAGGDRVDPGQRAGLGERDLLLAAPPSFARISLRCSSLITSRSTVTDVTPSTASTARGHPPGDLVAHRASGDRQVDVDVDRAAVDPDVLDHPELGDGAADLGVLDLGKGGVNLSRV